MRDEHQTYQGSTLGSTQDAAQTSARPDEPSPLAHLQIQLRSSKPAPLPDPFQFSVYLAQLASSDQSS
jgi:hypothetical protein